MATGIFGYFRFIKRGKELRGEYLNWHTLGLEPETGTKLTEEDGVFDGNYTTRWTDTSEYIAELTITHQQDETYLLLWNVQNTDVHYRGRGIINDGGELVGFYEMRNGRLNNTN